MSCSAAAGASGALPQAEWFLREYADLLGLAPGRNPRAVEDGLMRRVDVAVVGGGYAGNQVQKNMQQNDVVVTNERRCRMVQEKTQQLVGYDVTFTLDGKQGVVRTSWKPGDTLPVRNGQIDTTPPAQAQALSLDRS